MIQIAFEGIDYWNRPVFKNIRGNSRYGSVEILYDYNTPEEKILKELTLEHLVFFGNEADCDPMGSACNVENMQIVTRAEAQKIMEVTVT